MYPAFFRAKKGNNMCVCYNMCGPYLHSFQWAWADFYLMPLYILESSTPQRHYLPPQECRWLKPVVILQVPPYRWSHHRQTLTPSKGPRWTVVKERHSLLNRAREGYGRRRGGEPLWETCLGEQWGSGYAIPHRATLLCCVCFTSTEATNACPSALVTCIRPFQKIPPSSQETTRLGLGKKDYLVRFRERAALWFK